MTPDRTPLLAVSPAAPQPGGPQREGRRLARVVASAGLALTVLTAGSLLGGCSALVAQNPAGELRPVNAVPDERDARLMLKGADVVAYFTEGRHVQGQAQFTSRYQDVSFRFASAKHQALFDAQPQRYLPQYGGYCANGIVYGIPWGGDADTWRVVDGKLYIFGGRGSQEAFELDIPGNRALADRYWAEEVQGRNSFWQRSWRLLWRVPHYQSGEALAERVRRAREGAAKP